MITEKDDFLAHPAESAAPDWFDRFWINAHSIDGRVTISQGIGIYANVGVVDGFAVVARGRDQRVVRGSRQGGDPSQLSIGPIAAEVVDPLRRWRFRLDPANDAGIAYDFEFRGTFEPIDCGRMGHWSHFTQAGTAAGKLVIDGEEIAVDPASWRAQRDRSWGLRPDTGRGRFNWVSAQLPSFHVWYLTVHDDRGTERRSLGWTRAAERDGGGVTDIAKIVRRPVFDDDGTFRSAEVELTMADGQRHELVFQRLASTAFMRAGLYGGWKGHRQGEPRGPLVVESERWDLGDTEKLGERTGLNDHVCSVTSGEESGVGIFELNHGR